MVCKVRGAYGPIDAHRIKHRLLQLNLTSQALPFVIQDIIFCCVSAYTFCNQTDKLYRWYSHHGLAQWNSRSPSSQISFERPHAHNNTICLVYWFETLVCNAYWHVLPLGAPLKYLSVSVHDWSNACQLFWHTICLLIKCVYVSSYVRRKRRLPRAQASALVKEEVEHGKQESPNGTNNIEASTSRSAKFMSEASSYDEFQALSNTLYSMPPEIPQIPLEK